NLASDFSMPAKPLSRYLCSTSSTVTSNPAVAATCAMPEPISPQPRTPTLLISIALPFLTTEGTGNTEETIFSVTSVSSMVKQPSSYFPPPSQSPAHRQ